MTARSDSPRSTMSLTVCNTWSRGGWPTRPGSPVRGWSYGGYLTQAALAFHPELFAAGVSICGMSDLSTFYRNTEAWIAAAAYPKYGHPISDRDLLDQLSPLLHVDALTAPLLLVHGANDTNVPVSESDQMAAALTERGRTVRYLLFEDDGHEIAKRENRAKLAVAVRDWLRDGVCRRAVTSL